MPPLATSGEAAEPTPIAWSEAISPAQFAAGCRWITATITAHRGHIAFDLWSNLTLASLGCSEGVAVFEDGVKDWHKTEIYCQRREA
jgi:hypothetical protein